MDNRDYLQHVVKVYLVTALIGAAEIALVRYLLLPKLAGSLTPDQLNWLHHAFTTHPMLFLLSILVLVMLLGLPVLLVGLRMWRRV